MTRALVEQLPQECTVYHSYPWLRPDRNDKTGKVTLKEGETDFVLIIPDMGILVLEIKGGHIDYNHETRQWCRLLENGRLKKIKDPFEQARKNMHFLKDKIDQRNIEEIRLCGGHSGYRFEKKDSYTAAEIGRL